MQFMGSQRVGHGRVTEQQVQSNVYAKIIRKHFFLISKAEGEKYYEGNLRNL